MKTLKKIGFLLLVIFYILAGANHFISARAYIQIMPAYFPFKPALNLLAGFFEILFALLLLHPKTKKSAARGIIVMLLVFLTVHIDMMQHAPVKMGVFTVTATIAWLRLPLQGVLIWWVWWVALSPKSVVQSP